MIASRLEVNPDPSCDDFDGWVWAYADGQLIRRRALTNGEMRSSDAAPKRLDLLGLPALPPPKVGGGGIDHGARRS
ncbi:MAG: hypothetical protein HC897_12155 [Thermoanaerobaculia bacterium]|nr:hypothetical protein [Thermoanaerobaculia bacterium]